MPPRGRGRSTLPPTGDRTALVGWSVGVATELLRSIDGVRIDRWPTGRDEDLRVVKNTTFRDHWGRNDSTPAAWERQLNGHAGRTDLSFVAADAATDEPVAALITGRYPADPCLHRRGQRQSLRGGTPVPQPRLRAAQAVGRPPARPALTHRRRSSADQLDSRTSRRRSANSQSRPRRTYTSW